MVKYYRWSWIIDQNPDLWQPLFLFKGPIENRGISFTLAVGMRRADQPLANAVNNALGRLMDDGTLRSIYARYGIDYRPPPLD